MVKNYKKNHSDEHSQRNGENHYLRDEVPVLSNPVPTATSSNQSGFIRTGKTIDSLLAVTPEKTTPQRRMQQEQHQMYSHLIDHDLALTPDHHLPPGSQVSPSDHDFLASFYQRINRRPTLPTSNNTAMTTTTSASESSISQKSTTYIPEQVLNSTTKSNVSAVSSYNSTGSHSSTTTMALRDFNSSTSLTNTKEFLGSSRTVRFDGTVEVLEMSPLGSSVLDSSKSPQQQQDASPEINISNPVTYQSDKYASSNTHDQHQPRFDADVMTKVKNPFDNSDTQRLLTSTLDYPSDSVKDFTYSGMFRSDGNEDQPDPSRLQSTNSDSTLTSSNEDDSNIGSFHHDQASAFKKPFAAVSTQQHQLSNGWESAALGKSSNVHSAEVVGSKENVTLKVTGSEDSYIDERNRSPDQYYSLPNKSTTSVRLNDSSESTSSGNNSNRRNTTYSSIDSSTVNTTHDESLPRGHLNMHIHVKNRTNTTAPNTTVHSETSIRRDGGYHTDSVVDKRKINVQPHDIQSQLHQTFRSTDYTQTKEQIISGSGAKSVSMNPNYQNVHPVSVVHGDRNRFNVKSLLGDNRRKYAGSVSSNSFSSSNGEESLSGMESLESQEGNGAEFDSMLEPISVVASDLRKGKISRSQKPGDKMVPESVLARAEFSSTLRVKKHMNRIRNTDVDLEKAVKIKLKTSEKTKTLVNEKAYSQTNQDRFQFRDLPGVEVKPEDAILLAEEFIKVKAKNSAAASTSKSRYQPKVQQKAPPDLMEFFSRGLERETASYSTNGIPRYSNINRPQTAPQKRAFDLYRRVRAWENWD